MRLMEERELFTHRFNGVDPDAVWSALKRVLATMDLTGADDTARVARFSTGASATSWGQHIVAQVVERAPSGTILTVRGRPKASLLTTPWGEKRHARGVERQITADIEANLAS
jgi:hypothetical protein